MRRLLMPLVLLLVGQAAAADRSHWVQADDLLVRLGPSASEPVRGVLQRGDEVQRLGSGEFDGYCAIQGEGLHGHVACRFLSAEPVGRPRAGQGGIAADRRWINGGGVLLRASPAPDGEMRARLARRASVRLLAAAPASSSRYCEVQPLDRQGEAQGGTGFVACSFLALELPRAEAPLPPDAAPADLAAAFWQQPGWWKLEAYASALAKRLPDPSAGPWPRDAELERMKAHLALGLKANPPPPLSDWQDLKQLAAAHDATLLAPSAQAQAQPVPDRARWAQEQRAQRAAQRLQNAIGLQGPLHDVISAEGAGARVLRLVQVLEMPALRPSLFRSEAEIGPPGDGAEALAGRFGGIVRTTLSPRSTTAPVGQQGAGLYDMRARTQQLARPLQRVLLLRDGRLLAETSSARSTELLWRDVDQQGGCEDWTPGFGFGDADPSIWHYLDAPGERGPGGAAAARRADEAKRPRGTLFAFYVASPPPREAAVRNEQAIQLDRKATGFAAATQSSYDLDHDGVPDLLVWEGSGPSSDPRFDAVRRDDRWFRFALVNVNGAWKLLGHDAFVYACGC